MGNTPFCEVSVEQRTPFVGGMTRPLSWFLEQSGAHEWVRTVPSSERNKIMASFVPAFFTITPIDSRDLRHIAEAAQQADELAPDTVRSLGSSASVGGGGTDVEPPTLRQDEISAVAPRAPARTLDPSAYVVDASSTGEWATPASRSETNELTATSAHSDAPITGIRSRIGGLVHALGVAVERFVA